MNGEVDTPRRRRAAGVAAGHTVTAEAAAAMLRDGGNAVDAALAACFAACVVEPVLASLGGGGFAIVQSAATDEARVYDFFAQTPQHRHAGGDGSFFEINADFGETTQAFHIGVGAAATPGFIPGMFALWSSYGTLPMTTIVAPAIDAARNGTVVNDYQAFLLGVVSPIYRHDPASKAIYGGSSSQSLLASGEILRNADLANVLENLAKEGLTTATDGDLAKLMIDCCQGNGGHLSQEDLAAYAVEVREPLSTGFGGSTFVTNPPPSSGGTLIAFSLGLMTRVERAAAASPSIADWTRVFEATQRARKNVRVDDEAGWFSLLDSGSLEAYARSLTDNPPAPRGTTHISVIDADDMAISVTLSNGEGCGIVVPGCGFMLNNMLGEEDINPNGIGRWPEDRRMASMMSPSVLRQSDGAITALGSGGSNRIRTAMAQVIARLSMADESLAAAISAPRCHIEGQTLFFEDPEGHYIDRDAITSGTSVTTFKRFSSPSMFFGGVHAVRRQADGGIEAIGDSRRAGAVAFVG